MDNGVNSVFMGVGGSFDVLSGHIKRAPMWMQKANLEWLFRVANEPKRLFKRYFVGNVSFIYKVVKEKKAGEIMGQFEVLKKIQEIELDALKEFNKICKENNLMFFLRGGSVMGAVKYQGFIPWDDDVDIAVPREDYDQLPQIFENKIIAGKYQVLCHQYCEELHCYFPRFFYLKMRE